MQEISEQWYRDKDKQEINLPPNSNKIMSWVATIELCLPDLKPYDDKLLKSNIDLD